MRVVKFAGEDWNVLKEENGKTLLAFRSGFIGNSRHLCFTTKDFFRTDCYRFYEGMREYLNVRFSDYVFSENDKKHIVVVENKYPIISTGTDDLGFHTTTFKMKAQKDRVFPLSQAEN